MIPKPGTLRLQRESNSLWRNAGYTSNRHEDIIRRVCQDEFVLILRVIQNEKNEWEAQILCGSNQIGWITL